MFECSRCGRNASEKVKLCRSRRTGDCPINVVHGRLHYSRSSALFLIVGGALLVYLTLSLASLRPSGPNTSAMTVILSILIISGLLLMGGATLLMGLVSLLSRRTVYWDRDSEDLVEVTSFRGYEYAFQTVTELSHLQISAVNPQVGPGAGSGVSTSGSTIGAIFSDDIRVRLSRWKECQAQNIEDGSHSEVVTSSEAERRIPTQTSAADSSGLSMEEEKELARDTLFQLMVVLCHHPNVLVKIGKRRASGEERGARVPLNHVVFQYQKLVSDEGEVPLQSEFLQVLRTWKEALGYSYSPIGPTVPLLLSEFLRAQTSGSEKELGLGADSNRITRELLLRAASSLDHKGAAHVEVADLLQRFRSTYPKLARTLLRQCEGVVGLNRSGVSRWFPTVSWRSFRSSFVAVLVMLFFLSLYHSKVQKVKMVGEFLQKGGEIGAEATTKMKAPVLESPLGGRFGEEVDSLEKKVQGRFSSLKESFSDSEVRSLWNQFEKKLRGSVPGDRIRRDYRSYKALVKRSLRSADASVRAQVLRTTRRFEDAKEELVDTYTYYAERDPSPAVRQAAIASLVDSGYYTPEVGDVLDRVARQDVDAGTRGAAEAALVLLSGGGR